MLCSSCAKLAYIPTQKKCIRCQGAVAISIAILCDFCSNTEKKCAVCIKKIITEAERQAKRGCNCGGK
jgi:hypothetical protein